MTFKEALLKFCSEQWAIVMLYVLLIILGMVHGFMIHYNRPHEQITWCEGMITGTFTAIIAKLK